MDFVISCWLIIESTVIPDGFLKWFYLSFYIQPCFLIVCQIFLWLKLLIRCTLDVIFYPLECVWFLCLHVSTNLKNYVSHIFLVSSPNVELAEELEISLVVQNCGQHQLIISTCSLHPTPPNCELYEVGLQGRELEDVSYEACHINGGIVSQSKDYSPPELCPSAEDIAMNEYIQSACGSNPSVMKTHEIRSQENEEADAFYDMYTMRMRWFDILSYERRCGLRQLEATSSVMNMVSTDYSNTFSTLNKESRKELLKSLESDIELVYVAQSCLSWEALSQQYRKVQALACSASAESIFYNSKLAGEFQKFHVLLERFVENEIYEGKRVWNFVQERSSSKNFLEVPQVSGFVVCSNEETNAEATSVQEMIKLIEQCIKVFFSFMETDNQKSSWKFRWFLSTQPLVGDPRDLRMLADLKIKLQKKELCLKGLQRKRKCWFKKIVNPLEESQWKEVLFAMIDMKLVSRVLRMNYLSSSQLKWCHEKLDSIEIIEGVVTRADTNALFPFS